MQLTPEQKAAVASWVTAGDNLSVVQRKLTEQFKLSLTYRDVRFLVDDLELTLKDPAPKVDTSDLTKATVPPPGATAGAPRQSGAEKKGFLEKAKEKLGLAHEAAGEPGEEDLEEALPPSGASQVSVTVDKATLIPGAIASGSVTFSDGVTANWVVDQYGRPGFSKISQPGYRPTPEDGQAFMRELSAALQQRGF